MEKIEMFELLTLVVSVWLMVKAFRLVFRLTWGITKIVAGILIALAFPALILCFLFIGGFSLIIPILIIGIVVGVLNSNV